MTEAAVAVLPSPTDEPLSSIAGIPVYNLADMPTRLSAMFFGTTGAGKTHLLGTVAEVPEMLPALVIDLAGGMRTLQTTFKEARIKIITPEGTSGVEKFLSLDKIFEGLKSDGGGGYKTIGIDQLSEGYNICMEWWLAHEKQIDPKRDIDLPGAAGGKDDFGRDWNKVRSMVRKMVRGFSGLGTHIIFTAHDKDEESRTSKLTLNMPSFPGQAVKDILGFVDEVYYVYTKESTERDPVTKLPKVQHWAQCQPTNVRPMCKTRGKLPLVLQEPTIAEIVRLSGIPL